MTTSRKSELQRKIARLRELAGEFRYDVTRRTAAQRIEEWQREIAELERQKKVTRH
jgi:hypothetical protein